MTTLSGIPAELREPNRPCNLVTGMLGFAGRHLSRSLVMAGLPVVGIDRADQPADLPDVLGDFRRQPSRPDESGFTRYDGPAGTLFYLACSLTDADALAQVVRDLHPVMIYHLAAQSSAAASFADPIGTMQNNVLGTQNLLEAVRQLPPALWPVVLAVGSCEEYGPQPGSAYPLTEDTPLNPLSPYAVSKATQTLLCQQYVKAWDLPVIIARAFSHTGPGQDPRFAFPAFARQIAAAEKGRSPSEIVTGDLSAVRDFLHVRDVVCAYRLLMKDGIPGEVYNVCSGQSLTIRKGLEIMIAEATCPVTVTTDPALLRPADTPVMVGDNSKIKEVTGWAPEWDITQTLRDLLNEARRELA